MGLLLVILMGNCRHGPDHSNETIVAHLPTSPATLHPTNGNGAYRYFIFQYTQMSLQRTDIRNGKLIHPLLTGPPEPGPDRLSYTYELKDGITWDDGSSLTVGDVVFTIKMNICPLTNNASQRSLYDPIAKVKTLPDKDRQFKVLFNQRHFANPRIFANGLWLMKRSKEDPLGVMADFSISDFRDPDFDGSDHPALETFMERFNDGARGHETAKLNGLGPYKVERWRGNNLLTLKRKKDWWGKDSDLVYHQQGPEKITFKVIRDNFAAGLALRNFTIDVSNYISLDELMKARQQQYFRDQYYSDFVQRYGYTYIGLNMRPGPGREPYFTRQKVRKAIAHLVPVQELIQVIAKGKARRQASFISPLKASYNEELPLIKENIPKARRLLSEAGWKDDDGDGIRDTVINEERIQFAFDFHYIQGPNRRQIAMLISEVMEEAGITFQPKALEFATFYERARNHEFDAMLGRWAGYSGPENPRQLWHTETWLNNGSNFTGFGNAKTDSMIEVANHTMDMAKRRELMKKLQRRVYQQQPYVFLFSKKRGIAVHRRFDSVGMYPERPGLILNNLQPTAPPGQLSAQ